MINYGVVVRAASTRLEQIYGTAPATIKQLQCVNIFLGEFAHGDDDIRYKLVQKMFRMPETPLSTKILTRAKCGTIIHLIRSGHQADFSAYVSGLLGEAVTIE